MNETEKVWRLTEEACAGVDSELSAGVVRLAGIEPLSRPLPNLALGFHRGRLWALRLEVASAENPGIPSTLPQGAERVGVALSVCRWALASLWAQTTSGLRARLRRTGTWRPIRRQR